MSRTVRDVTTTEVHHSVRELANRVWTTGDLANQTASLANHVPLANTRRSLTDIAGRLDRLADAYRDAAEQVQP